MRDRITNNREKKVKDTEAVEENINRFYFPGKKRNEDTQK